MRKIYKDRPVPTSEEIQKFKNFNLLLGQHAHGPKFRKPFYRSFWFNAITLVVLGCFLLLVFRIIPSRRSNSQNQEIIAQRPFIHPPVKEWARPYTRIIINNRQDTLIVLSSGSSVQFPKASITDKSGKAVYDSIEIRVQEISNPGEIFLAGIPMEYDSGGVKRTFESAAMMDIEAFKNNQPLYINKYLPVKVNLVSSTTERNYNLYYLDTAIRNWVYMGKDSLSTVQKDIVETQIRETAATSDSLDSIRADIHQLEVQKPEPPAIENQSKPHLKLDLRKGEFPELDIYEKTRFEVLDSNKPILKKNAQQTWEDVSITRGDLPSTYQVCFRTKTDSCRYLVRPVFKDKDYKMARAIFDSKYQQYLQLLNERKRKEAQLQNKLFQSQDTTLIVKNTQEANETQSTLIRSFQIRNFGIWNCDRPRVIPNQRTITPVFELNDTVYSQTVYHVDYASNSLTSVYAGSALNYNPEAQNTLWLVTWNNKIAVVTPDDFKNIPASARKYRFKMHEIPLTLHSADDFMIIYNNGFIVKGN